MVHQHYQPRRDARRCGRTSCSASAARLDRDAACERVAEISERYGLGRRSRRPRRRPDGRAAPAGRDHQVPAARPRRSSCSTSRRPCSRRPRASSCSTALRARGRGGGRRSRSSATSSTRSCRRPTRSRSCARAGWSSTLPAADADARTLARAMVGREVSLRSEAARSVSSTRRVEGRPTCRRRRGRRRAPVAARGPRRVGRRRRRRTRCSTASSLDVAPARSSASPASRATASGQLGRRAVQPDRARRRHGRGRRARRADRHGRARWPRAGVAVIPEDRHDSGCVLDMTVAENLCHGRPRSGRQHGGPARPRWRCGSGRPS